MIDILIKIINIILKPTSYRVYRDNPFIFNIKWFKANELIKKEKHNDIQDIKD